MPTPTENNNMSKRMVTLQYIGIPYVINNGERKVLYKFMKMVKNDFLKTAFFDSFMFCCFFLPMSNEY